MLNLKTDKPKKDTRIVVAMSGGVDSSTVAAMLHNYGYQVIGVTLQLYDIGEIAKKKGACCAGQDIYDAKQVAETLGFAHYVLDYESLFKQSVIEDFADSYVRGETPIPCVRCNQTVKFRDLFKVAKDLNADALVTGHYVQRVDVEGKAQMHRGIDHGKDQSYFLFATTKDQLEYIHFPLGGLTKDKTREIAKGFGLEVADKPDSQDICFVPNGDYASIVSRLRPGALDKGEIRHVTTNELLGVHDGIINYTIGQRKGLGLSWPEALFVVKIDPVSKNVYVGEADKLGKSEFNIIGLNWLGEGEIPTSGLEVEVKLRSMQQPMKATIYPEGAKTKVILESPERAVTPGQACVMYDGNRLLGGGWIIRD